MTKPESDHDLLVRLCEKTDTITKMLSNHLEHHFWYNVTLLAGFLATATAVGLYLLG